MENKLEQLLNSLIEKGWKPNGLEKNDIQDISYDKDRKEISIQYIKWCTPSKFDLVTLSLSLRELVSRESGLWQFVCENGMINVPHPNKGKYPRDKLEREQYKYWDRTIGYYGEDNLDRMGYSWDKYQYRLIESSLKDESELEEFLLSNIKVEGKNE